MSCGLQINPVQRLSGKPAWRAGLQFHPDHLRRAFYYTLAAPNACCCRNTGTCFTKCYCGHLAY